MIRRSGPVARGATLLVALAAATLYVGFADYGFNLDDEGTVLYQILRTARGERPYLDFHTGYTPAGFYLNAALFDLFGVSVRPLRLLLAAVNTASVVMILRLALRLAPPLEASLAALCWGLFLPFFAGQFASFNIPYPAWYATLGWLMTEWACVRAAEAAPHVARSRGWILVAGVLAGLTFSFKPNTGVMALGAVVLARLATAPPLRGRLGSLLEGLVLGIAVLGVPAVLAFDLATKQFALLGLPALVFLVGLALRARRLRRQGSDRPVGAGILDLVVVVVGFGAPVATWLGLFLPQLGWAGFAREVLLLGAGVEEIYLLYFPDLSAWSAAGLLVLGFVVALPWVMARGWLGVRGAIGLLGVSAALGIGALAVFGLAPEGLLLSVGMQIENLSYFVVPLVLVVAVLIWFGRAGRRDEEAGRVLGLLGVALAFGVLHFLQLFPRIDFMHVVISMPSALVVAAGVLWQAERWAVETLGAAGIESRVGRARLVRLVAAAPIVVVLLARLGPFVEARFDLAGGVPHLRELTPMEFPALAVGLEADRDHDLRELREVGRFVGSRTSPDEPIFAFPALGIVPFMTDRITPVPHDYFFAGRPSHADEAVMRAQIEAARPALIVTLNDRLGYFSAAPAYYFILRDYFERGYQLVRRIGRFDVLARRDLVANGRFVPEPAGAAWRAAGEGSAGRRREVVLVTDRLAALGSAAELASSSELLGDVDRENRGSLIRAAVAIAGRTPGGIGAVADVMAPRGRARLLFVRTLGEYAGAAALPWLEGVFLESPDARLRWEAARSINYILARGLASRFDLLDAPAPDASPFDLPAGLQPERTTALVADFEERQRIGPLAALAAADAGRRDLAPRLDHFASERETTWWRMLAAWALLRLGQDEHARTFYEAIDSGTLGGQYVPSILLDPALTEPVTASRLVAAMLVTGSAEGRETAAWMAPYLVVPVPEPALRAALADPEPGVQRAARWALDEIARREGTAGRVHDRGAGS